MSISDSDRSRVNVYVDGFNLYYGALMGTKLKWLDLQKYFEKLRPADSIETVYFFTARVHGNAKSDRQASYLRALSTLPKVRVIEGRYKTKRANCKVKDCCYVGERRFTTWEEKRTDVNIAIQLIDDAYQDKYDRAIVVSGDSDLVTPIYLLKSRFTEKQVTVYVPARDRTRGAATELRNAADQDRTLPNALLKHAQLPSVIGDGADTITKPESW